jgi:hypothetical protein
MTASDALRNLREQSSPLHGQLLFVGQGIDGEVRDELGAAAPGAGATLHAALDPASLAITHKAHRSCVLISEPERLAEGHYRAELILGGATDRLSDHVTGQHLGGMVVVEAARQLGIAAIELDYAKDGQMPYGIIWNYVSSRFLAYAFPIPTELSVKLWRDEARSRRNQVAVSLAFEVKQCDQLIAELSMETGLLDKATLRKIEAKRAAQTVDKLCRGVAELAEPALAAAAATAR